MITENKNSLHCIECCWLQAQAFRPVQLYFHPWKLAADIPVAAGFICLSLNIYFFSFSTGTLILNQCFLIFANLYISETCEFLFQVSYKISEACEFSKVFLRNLKNM